MLFDLLLKRKITRVMALPVEAKSLSTLVLIASIATALFINGCALPLPQHSAKLRPISGGEQIVTLTGSVTVVSPTTIKKVLAKGSRWQLLGTVPQGKVYKPLTQVLTIESQHQYEAYIVVSSGQVVGFYLPVPETFVLAEKPSKWPID